MAARSVRDNKVQNRFELDTLLITNVMEYGSPLSRGRQQIKSD